MCYPSRETSLDEFLQEMVELINGHDRSAKTLDDPEWLEIEGHPTIPHVQSLREPPAKVALQSQSERLIGLTHRNASKRYLEKLQKERERNQEVLAECVDRLPIVIKQASYPDKQISARHPFPASASSDSQRQETRQEHTSTQSSTRTERTDDEGTKTHKARRKLPNVHVQSSRKRDPEPLMSDAEEAETNSFIHHQGFTGIHERQTYNLRYKFGKKKPGPIDEHQEFSMFNPKGYGSLHDELETERRSKRVTDGSKNLHFENANFLNGQKINKHSKLPPIARAQMPDSSNDNCGSLNSTYAIMSVQRINHPKEVHVPTGQSEDQPNHSLTNVAPGTPIKSDRAHVEMNIPAPLISSTKAKILSGSPRYRGARGQLRHLASRETTPGRSPSLQDSDSAFGTLTEEIQTAVKKVGNTVVSQLHSANSDKSKKTRNKGRVECHTKTSHKDVERTCLESVKDSDYEPSFNISVSVEIKPKNKHGDDVDGERALGIDRQS